MIEQTVALTATALMHIICYILMSERKYSVKKTALIYSVFLAAFIGLGFLLSRILFGFYSFRAISFFLICSVLAAFFVFVITSADPFCKKIFLFFSYSTVFCIFYCVSVMVCGIWFKSEFESGAVYAKTITRTLLCLLAIWLYIRFLRPAVREVSGNNKKTWYSISLVSLLFLIVFSIFLVIYYMDNDFRAWHSILFAVTVLIYCAVLWVIFGTIRYMRRQNRMELIEKNVEYLQGQLALANENELLAKTIRHDFRHHTQNIAAMLKKGDVGEALHYIEQYGESLDEAKLKEFCPHITVNAILNSFYTRTQTEGIAVSISADTQKETAVADMDFVAILSNLLENAVNGCKECHSCGEIAVSIRTVADKIVMVCSNPCKPGLVIENNRVKNKGIGIDSMLSAAKKYDGDVSYSLEDGILTVCVILKS